MTRKQFDLVSKLIAGMAELADQVVPDIMQFASPGEAHAVLANIEEIQGWFEVLILCSDVATGA
jgi:hypothetical protein